MLADQGYILAWLWHSKGVGPEGLTNYFTKKRGFANTQALVLELATTKDSDGARLLARNKHHIWLDNLFTTSALLAELRRHSIGASGTVRTTSTKAELIEDANVDGDFLLLEATQASIANELQQESTSIETSQVVSEVVSEVASQQSQKPRVYRCRSRKASLVVTLKVPNRHPLLSQIKEEEKVIKGTGLTQDLINLRKQFNNQIPWGSLYAVLSEDQKSIQFAWKDQNLVLFMSSACTGRDLVIRERRKPAKTSTNACSSRKVFAKDKYTKNLPIPSFIDLYNHHMGGVDQQDQLRSYYTTQRQHVKPWKSLWHWLLDLAIINSYKLSSYTSKSKSSSQKRFRKDLAARVLECSERFGVSNLRGGQGPMPPKPPKAPPSERRGLEDLVVPVLQVDLHQRYKIKKSTCKPCVSAGRFRQERDQNTYYIPRRALGPIDPNIHHRKRRERSPEPGSGCMLCRINICNNNTCWEEHVRASKRRKEREI